MRPLQKPFRGVRKKTNWLAFVIDPDSGKSLGLELVKAGLARVYSNNFAPDNPDTYKRY